MSLKVTIRQTVTKMSGVEGFCTGCSKADVSGNITKLITILYITDSLASFLLVSKFRSVIRMHDILH